MDFFISLPLSFSPVTTGAGAGDRRARPGGGSGGSVICPFIEKKIVICDLWRLEVKEEWKLLDLNPMVQKKSCVKTA